MKEKENIKLERDRSLTISFLGFKLSVTNPGKDVILLACICLFFLLLVLAVIVFFFPGSLGIYPVKKILTFL